MRYAVVLIINIILVLAGFFLLFGDFIDANCAIFLYVP